MATQEEFEDAAARVEQLTKRPSNDELLELYALYKQATAGDASGKRPSRFKLKARAKHDAWADKKGTDQSEARDQYVQLVEKLEGKYNT